MNGFYQGLAQQLAGLIEDEQDFIANRANGSAPLDGRGRSLQGRFELRAGTGWRPLPGTPVVIPWVRGFATAVQLADCIIVPDVHEFPGHRL